MKFKELFQDVEDWFWKLEFNPETQSYELYLGIPNDWVYNQNTEEIKIELIHQLEDNSIIKIYYTDGDFTVDDVLDTAKLLISKNKELEKRKEAHREEMERLKNLLIEKEKNFLEYIDTVKDHTLSTTEIVKNDGVSEGVNEGASEGVTKSDEFLNDIEKLKLK